MAYLIVAEDAIGVLSASELPAAVGGGANPFKDLIEFLDKTRGHWVNQKDVRGGRAELDRLVAGEHGVPPVGSPIYKSRYFSSTRLPISVIPQAMGLFAAEGIELYFELIQFPCFVQLADQQYDNQTPLYLPNSRIDEVDGDGGPTGEITKVTWDNWHDATHQHLSHEGQNYVPLNSNTGGGNDLAGSVLNQLIAGGYDVKPMGEWPVIESVEP